MIELLECKWYLECGCARSENDHERACGCHNLDKVNARETGEEKKRKGGRACVEYTMTVTHRDIKTLSHTNLRLKAHGQHDWALDHATTLQTEKRESVCECVSVCECE